MISEDPSSLVTPNVLSTASSLIVPKGPFQSLPLLIPFKYFTLLITLYLLTHFLGSETKNSPLSLWALLSCSFMGPFSLNGPLLFLCLSTCSHLPLSLPYPLDAYISIRTLIWLNIIYEIWNITGSMIAKSRGWAQIDQGLNFPWTYSFPASLSSATSLAGAFSGGSSFRKQASSDLTSYWINSN